MKFKIEFQYKGTSDARPQDYVQEIDIGSDVGDFIPFPGVGDSVSLKLSAESMKAYKVLSRHFSYMVDYAVVNIVVTDISDDEMARRLKM